MSEQEIREGMLLAVWDEPPLDFDPDRLMKRAEQKKSRRRALVSVGVATAMIVVSAFSLPSLLSRTGDGDQVASSRTESSPPTPTEAPDVRALRIGNGLAERLGLLMPELQEVSSNVISGRNFQSIELGKPINTTAPQVVTDRSLSGYVFLRDGIGPTSLEVQAGPRLQDTRALCLGASMCRDVQQKDGSTVTEAEYMDGTSALTRAVVLRVLPNGYAVQITAFNYNPATGRGVRAALPVRVEALTTLVTDPRIRWE